MSTLQVTPDPAGTAGRALIRVAGAAGSVGAPGFRVQRDADWTDATLGPEGWQSSDALLQPDRAEADGPDLLLHVGWPVCRFLEGGVYEVSVPGAGVAPTGVFWPDITPPAPVAAAVPVPTPPPVPVPTPSVPVAAPTLSPAEPRPSAPAPQPVPALDPMPVAPAPGRRLLLPGVLALLLVLAIGGTIAYRQFAPPGPVVVDTPAPPITPPLENAGPTPPVVPPLDLGTLSVPEVLARAPNPAAITAEGERRLRGDRRDDGLVLLEEAADRGEAAAAAAIARLYDPVLFQPGGAIPRADARQAARRYRDAARGGADVTAARDALQRQLQERAGRGDMGADLMLKDFWP